jgi:pimeloyl-ACP methyl ester carboxylesterase
VHRTVIAVVLPGFGASPPLVSSGPPPNPAGFAVVLADLLRRLGHDTAHLAGNWVGGWTVIEMAKLATARSVVALSPAGLWVRRAPLYDVLSLRAPPAPVASPGPATAADSLVRALRLWPRTDLRRSRPGRRGDPQREYDLRSGRRSHLTSPVPPRV